MRTTLITGLLLCLPTAVLLASMSLAVLAGQLCRFTKSQFSDLPTAGPDREELRDDVTPASAGRLCASPQEAPARGAVLPDSDCVPSRVPGHRHPQITAGYGWVGTS